MREQEKDIDILFYGYVGSRTRRDSMLRLLQGENYNISIEIVNMYVYRCASKLAASAPCLASKPELMWPSPAAEVLAASSRIASVGRKALLQ